MEVEIGRGKKGRRAYGFDDIAIVPSRRTRDPDDIDITWTLGPYRFELPLVASAMDGVVSPAVAGKLGRLGGLAAASLTPQRVRSFYETAIDAGLDILVIQGTVISAEHVSARSEPLNLKEFIRDVPVPVVVGGCASYATGLH